MNQQARDLMAAHMRTGAPSFKAVSQVVGVVQQSLRGYALLRDALKSNNAGDLNDVEAAGEQLARDYLVWAKREWGIE